MHQVQEDDYFRAGLISLLEKIDSERALHGEDSRILKNKSQFVRSMVNIESEI